jgi:hypothetical protein
MDWCHGTQSQHTNQEATMQKQARWAAIIAVGAAVIVGGTVHAAAAAPASTPRTVTYYAFDIDNGTTDPGFIAVPGTNPAVFAQGDELIINEQLTTTHKVGSGYPIVGYDSGVCTLTRIPEKYAEQTYADCVVTAVWKTGGSITVQGVVAFKAQQPEPAVLAITGGTGGHSGAAGSVHLAFTAQYDILTFALK